MAELRILMLEDEAGDARLIQHELRRGNVAFVAQVVDTRETFLKELIERRPDLILADYSLPSFDGLSALALVRQHRPEVPFLFVSGAIGEERAIEALRNGATDYVLKDRPSRLVPAVQRALREVEERTRRAEAERLTAATNALLALLPKKLSPREYLGAVVELLRGWTGCHCVGIRELDTLWEVPYKAYVGFSRQYWEGVDMLALDRDVRSAQDSVDHPDRAATTRSGSLRAQDVQETPGRPAPADQARFFSTCAAEGLATHAIVPLRYRERVIGSLHFADTAPAMLPEPVLHLVEELAPLIGEALHSFDVEQELRRNLQRLETLHAIDRAILASQSPQEIAEATARQIREMTPATCVSVTLCDGQGLAVRTLAVDAGAPTIPPNGESVAPGAAGQPVLPRADSAGQAVNVEPMARRRSQPGQGSPADCIALPLEVGGEVLGHLQLAIDHPGRLASEYLDLAGQVADSLAVAISNARLFEQVTLGRRQLQELSHRRMTAQEEERRAIARELHDEAGQGLTTVKLGLGLLQKELQDNAGATARIEELKTITDNVMSGLHDLAANLRPASLDRLGLIPVLRRYLMEYEARHGLSVEFDVHGLDGSERLPTNLELAMYRIVQEALTNVVRHAQATRVGILLGRQADWTTAIVEDNGRGFDVAESMARGRLGLIGMQERAEMLGGTLTIESAPGMGTTVYVQIPVCDVHPGICAGHEQVLSTDTGFGNPEPDA